MYNKKQSACAFSGVYTHVNLHIMQLNYSPTMICLPIQTKQINNLASYSPTCAYASYEGIKLVNELKRDHFYNNALKQMALFAYNRSDI